MDFSNVQEGQTVEVYITESGCLSEDRVTSKTQSVKVGKVTEHNEPQSGWVG